MELQDARLLHDKIEAAPDLTLRAWHFGSGRCCRIDESWTEEIIAM